MISSFGVAAARRAAASSLLNADNRLSALAVAIAPSRAAPGRRQHRRQSTSLFSTNNPARKNVVVVDGVRLPFAMTSTIYEDQLAVDLLRLAYQGLVTKTALNKGDVDYIIAGTVIQEVRTSNIAREAGINAGFPASIGAHTVSMVRSIHGGCYHTAAINFVSFRFARSFVAMLLWIIITFLRS
jgi:acetyl-CoA acyltransferase